MKQNDASVFKITAYETFQEGKPTFVRIANVKQQLIKSKLFRFLGDSRIDGYPMFVFDTVLVLRKMKIDKILNKEHIDYRQEAIKLLGKYSGDIEHVQSYKSWYE